MEYYFSVLKNYAVFSGRARRKEYWMFTLMNIVVLMILVASDAFTSAFDTGYGVGYLTIFYSLAILIPSLAVTIRRLHDTGRSGWWYFIGLVPVVGSIAMLVFTLQEGNIGSNEYGQDPKDEE
jgi:uncharacterized membrane protein YhaH (DUF805 family)